MIDETHLLDLFPERTAADFFVWIKAYHQELQARYGKRIMIEEAARDFRKQKSQFLPTRTLHAMLGWLAT